MKRLRLQKGFTLIELLVVIAIIGVLASIVLTSLNSARAKSRDVRRITDLKQIEKALWLYYDSNNSTFPICADAFLENQTNCLATALVPTYMAKMPIDPVYGGNGTSGNFDYEYWTTTDGKIFSMRAGLETDAIPATGTYPGQAAGYCGTPARACNWYSACVYKGYGNGCETTLQISSETQP